MSFVRTSHLSLSSSLSFFYSDKRSANTYRSEFGREGPSIGGLLRFLLARSTEVGSRTLVHGGLQGAQSHGKYLSDCKITEPGTNVRSEEGKQDQERVFRELTAKLEGIKPGITEGY